MKSSFILYYEYEEQLSILSDEEMGKLIRAVFNYEKTGIVPNFDGLLKWRSCLLNQIQIIIG